MARNPETVSLFDKYGCVVRQTNPDASRPNSLSEGPHIYIVESFRSLIKIHQVSLKFWTYALSHYIKFHGMFPHGESELLPDEKNMEIDLMLGISIALAVGFISDLQVEVVTRCKIISKRGFYWIYIHLLSYIF